MIWIHRMWVLSALFSLQTEISKTYESLPFRHLSILWQIWNPIPDLSLLSLALILVRRYNDDKSRIRSRICRKRGADMDYIKRAIEDIVLHSDKTFKSILITGARQTGKTKLIKELFPDKKYVLIDDPFIEEQATSNPNMFMMLNPPPVIYSNSVKGRNSLWHAWTPIIMNTKNSCAVINMNCTLLCYALIRRVKEIRSIECNKAGDVFKKAACLITASDLLFSYES